MDTAQLIQSVRDGDYPKVATAVAIPAGHRALTVTPGSCGGVTALGGTRARTSRSPQPAMTPVGDLALQGRRDLNSQPSVLETGALPIELLPFAETRGNR